MLLVWRLLWVSWFERSVWSSTSIYLPWRNAPVCSRWGMHSRISSPAARPCSGDPAHPTWVIETVLWEEQQRENWECQNGVKVYLDSLWASSSSQAPLLTTIHLVWECEWVVSILKNIQLHSNRILVLLNCWTCSDDKAILFRILCLYVVDYMMEKQVPLSLQRFTNFWAEVFEFYDSAIRLS